MAATATLTIAAAPALARAPEVVEVPTGPAFVRLPGQKEVKARKGLNLRPATQLRTSKPGRMQVMLDLAGKQARRLKGTWAQLENAEALRASL